MTSGTAFEQAHIVIAKPATRRHEAIGGRLLTLPLPNLITPQDVLRGEAEIVCCFRVGVGNLDLKNILATTEKVTSAPYDHEVPCLGNPHSLGLDHLTGLARPRLILEPLQVESIEAVLGRTGLGCDKTEASNPTVELPVPTRFHQDDARI